MEVGDSSMVVERMGGVDVGLGVKLEGGVWSFFFFCVLPCFFDAGADLGVVLRFFDDLRFAASLAFFCASFSIRSSSTAAALSVRFGCRLDPEGRRSIVLEMMWTEMIGRIIYERRIGKIMAVGEFCRGSLSQPSQRKRGRIRSLALK